MHGAGISEDASSEVSKLAHLGECDTHSVHSALWSHRVTVLLVGSSSGRAIGQQCYKSSRKVPVLSTNSQRRLVARFASSLCILFCIPDTLNNLESSCFRFSYTLMGLQRSASMLLILLDPYGPEATSSRCAPTTRELLGPEPSIWVEE